MAPNSRTIRLTDRARMDLEEIWIYTLEKWSAARADTYYRDLVACFDSLAVGSKIGITTEVRAGYRKAFCGSHVIYHVISDHHIDIIRILHKRMDVDQHL